MVGGYSDPWQCSGPFCGLAMGASAGWLAPAPVVPLLDGVYQSVGSESWSLCSDPFPSLASLVEVGSSLVALGEVGSCVARVPGLIPTGRPCMLGPPDLW